MKPSQPATKRQVFWAVMVLLTVLMTGLLVNDIEKVQNTWIFFLLNISTGISFLCFLFASDNHDTP